MMGGVVVLILVLGWIWDRRPAAAEFLTGKIERGTIRNIIKATGTLRAVTRVQVRNQVSGTVSALYADFDAQVRKNQIITQLDPASYQVQGTIAGASLAEAQAQAQLQKAQAEGRQNEAALRLAEVNLSYTTIRSPIDRAVVSRNVAVGRTLAASLAAPTLFTMANDLTQMEVIASIDQAEIGSINASTQISFTVDAFPGRNFSGTINQLHLNSQNVQNTYNAVIDAANPDLKLKPGMIANLTFTIAERVKVLKIPNAALRFTPPGTTSSAIGVKGAPGTTPQREGAVATSAVLQGQSQVVWVMGTDHQPQPVSIKIGITDGVSTEITEGNVQEGEIVIVGQNRIGESSP